jgi:hypothetical protein
VTGTAVAVPLVAAPRDGDPVSGGNRSALTSRPAVPSASPTPDAEVLAGEVAGEVGTTDDRVTRPRKPPEATARIPERGSGRFEVAAASSDPVGDATTYRVEVEEGLPYSAEGVARMVEATLSDDRGWAAKHPLVRVDGRSDLRIVLAAPETADRLCAPLDTNGRLSCRNGGDVVLNAWRWRFGAASYAEDLLGYRRYVVNHETGHALGYPHAGCPGEGDAAPVMLQQTKGLKGCTANPWPVRVDLARH